MAGIRVVRLNSPQNSRLAFGSVRFADGNTFSGDNTKTHDKAILAPIDCNGEDVQARRSGVFSPIRPKMVSALRESVAIDGFPTHHLLYAQEAFR